jgi:hypothetical protein
VLVPLRVQEDHSGDVASYWVSSDERSIVLQFSSYLREPDALGPNASAGARLAESPFITAAIDPVREDLTVQECNDVAAGHFLDEHGNYWTVVYLVWPDQAILATVIGPEADYYEKRRWAIEAIQSITRD